MNDFENTGLRPLLCALGTHLQKSVLAARNQQESEQLATVAAESAADTIYAIDKISEAALLDWFGSHWPADQPVEVIAEGLEGEAVTFPHGTPSGQTRWVCILDPIDGTRGLMYDKRSAWSLVGVAPRPADGRSPTLADITVACMTELPTTKMAVADQLSAVRGQGLVAERRDLRTGATAPFPVRPSTATDLRHGFAGLVQFFPEGKALTAQLEADLIGQLHPLGETTSPVVFADQYISTGGQLYEILTGKDRFIADLRPVLLPRAGYPASLVCHPYDLCTGLLLTEAGGVLEDPLTGTFPAAPLDTTSPVTWAAYANTSLARRLGLLLRKALKDS